MPVFIVLLGPPGAGKGTQAQKIAHMLHIPHISSGDIFRENFKNKTELGKLANRYISRGELVPDDITIAMIRERLSQADCHLGALLDGFPRTPAQAKALDDMLLEFDGKIDAVPYIDVPEQVLVERMAGRFTCKAQGHVYHLVHNSPKVAGICDVDGSELYQREDDKPETVKNRYRVFLQNTQPLMDYYREMNVLVEIDGTRSIEEVSEQLLAILPEVKG